MKKNRSSNERIKTQQSKELHCFLACNWLVPYSGNICSGMAESRFATLIHFLYLEYRPARHVSVILFSAFIYLVNINKNFIQPSQNLTITRLCVYVCVCARACAKKILSEGNKTPMSDLLQLSILITTVFCYGNIPCHSPLKQSLLDVGRFTTNFFFQDILIKYRYSKVPQQKKRYFYKRLRKSFFIC